MTQNVMTYRGYAASVAYDDGDGVFTGKVLDISDTLLFSGESVDELRSSFRSLIDDYLAYCERTGAPADRPFSGRVQLRLSPQHCIATRSSLLPAGIRASTPFSSMP
ncbi:MAG: type II toxin-antitoxin system HicB family antitoxin [Trueperaceae bacterium]|nr:type II toxin-antitoxin system HicB family antitoxin [Trueperaceae bacterium]